MNIIRTPKDNLCDVLIKISSGIEIIIKMVIL